MADIIDTGDETQAKAARFKQGLIGTAEDEALRTVLSTYAGRAVFWRLLSACRIYSDSFTGDERTYYYEGKRSIGLGIIEMIENVNPHVMAQIRDEAVERQVNG